MPGTQLPPPSRPSLVVDGVPIIRLESTALRVDIAPSVGGRIISLFHKQAGLEFLWKNRALSLQRLPAGSEYDPNFYGGIDELLPNDIPEDIDGVDCPDHGELWTTPLEWEAKGNALVLRGRLLRFGLSYEREMSLRTDSPVLDLRYRIVNTTNSPRQFLWKLHAALAIEAGDVIDCPARKAQIVDPAWSRFKTIETFAWPQIEGQSANVIPDRNGTMDFFYLFDLTDGQIALRSPRRGVEFIYRFDPRVFPYAWLFASYGGFNDHYTGILEPCTAMPMSVNEAAARKQCPVLGPGHALETSVSIYAGPQ